MKHIFCTILFVIVAILLTNLITSVGSAFAIDPLYSCKNPQDNHPTKPVPEKHNSKEIQTITILLLSFGFIGLAEAGKQKKIWEKIIMERTALPDSV